MVLQPFGFNGALLRRQGGVVQALRYHEPQLHLLVGNRIHDVLVAVDAIVHDRVGVSVLVASRQAGGDAATVELSESLELLVEAVARLVVAAMQVANPPLVTVDVAGQVLGVYALQTSLAGAERADAGRSGGLDGGGGCVTYSR